MKKSLVILLVVLSLAFISCQSSEPVEDAPAIVLPEAAAPVEAPAPVPVVKETPAVESIIGTLYFEGYEIGYSAVPGSATVTYPIFITDAEINAFFAYAYSKNTVLLGDVFFEITAPGTMNITFPESVTIDDAQAVVDILAGDLVDFVQLYLGVEL